jgi:hypothetical protein
MSQKDDLQFGGVRPLTALKKLLLRYPSIERTLSGLRCLCASHTKSSPPTMSPRIALPALLAILSSATSFAQQAPPGWRALQQSDWGIDADRVTLNDTHVRGDFNGDGKIDHAQLLARSNEPYTRGVFVFLMLSNGQQTIHKLLACPTAQACADYALSVVRKGCYQEEQSGIRVCLRHEGIVFSEIEFGYGTLYWLDRGKWRDLKFTRGSLSNFPR